MPGRASGMTTQDDQPQGVGATGGLPGANADPRTAEPDEDATVDTVAATEPALPVGVENPDPAYADEGIDHAYDEPDADGGTMPPA